MAITRSHVLRMLTEHKIELMRRFGVTDLALFWLDRPGCGR